MKTGQALVLVSGVFKRLLVARARLSRAVEAFGVRSPVGSGSQAGGREVDDVRGLQFECSTASTGFKFITVILKI